MKAMILAAGAGSRLHPLTENTPKPLVKFHGKTMLEILINKLRNAGFSEIIINVHHFAEQIIDYIRQEQFKDLTITISHEKELLDTGGGIKFALNLLGHEPVLFHNVDILTELDLKAFYEYHRFRNSQITLAVKQRNTSRSLLFTSNGYLGGWEYPEKRLRIITRNSKNGYAHTAFSGIYIINPELFDEFPEEDFFSVSPWIIHMS